MQERDLNIMGGNGICPKTLCQLLHMHFTASPATSVETLLQTSETHTTMCISTNRSINANQDRENGSRVWDLHCKNVPERPKISAQLIVLNKGDRQGRRKVCLYVCGRKSGGKREWEECHAERLHRDPKRHRKPHQIDLNQEIALFSNSYAHIQQYYKCYLQSRRGHTSQNPYTIPFKNVGKYETRTKSVNVRLHDVNESSAQKHGRFTTPQIPDKICLF